MDKEYSPIGKHITFDLFGINASILNDAAFLRDIYYRAIEHCGAEIRKYQEEVFDPEGLTFTYILSESHASCHTYPNKNTEDGCLMGCIHTCGEHVDPNIAVDYIIEILKPREIIRMQLTRGVREQGRR